MKPLRRVKKAECDRSQNGMIVTDESSVLSIEVIVGKNCV